MAQGPEQTAEQLAKVTARLEKLAKQQRGGGLLSGLKPFLLGALVGGGAALLYAPQPGEQTREFVRRNAVDLQESATQSAQTAKEKIQERTGTAQETVQKTLTQASDKIKATVGDGTTQANAAAQEAKQVASEGAKTTQAAATSAADTAPNVSQQQEPKAGRPQSA